MGCPAITGWKRGCAFWERSRLRFGRIYWPLIPHEELSVAPLPTGLRPPPHIVRGKEQRYCRTTFEAGQVAGFFHVPAHTRQATHNCAFTWCGSNVLLVAYDDFVQVCLHRVGQLSAHKNAGSADFIVDFLSVLIQDELPHIQRLEESLSSLEQDVLQGKSAVSSTK